MTRAKPMKRHFSNRRLVTVLSTPLLVLALAACAGESTPPDVASANSGQASKSNSFAVDSAQADGIKYAKCMRKNGIQMADPVDGKSSITSHPGDEAKMAKAQSACKDFAPTAKKGSGQGVSTADQDKALKFAQCMRENGVKMADPDFSSGDIKLHIEDPPQGRDQAKVDAAQQACAGLMPGPSK